MEPIKEPYKCSPHDTCLRAEVGFVCLLTIMMCFKVPRFLSMKPIAYWKEKETSTNICVST